MSKRIQNHFQMKPLPRTWERENDRPRTLSRQLGPAACAHIPRAPQSSINEVWTPNMKHQAAFPLYTQGQRRRRRPQRENLPVRTPTTSGGQRNIKADAALPRNVRGDFTVMTDIQSIERHVCLASGQNDKPANPLLSSLLASTQRGYLPILI